MSLSAIHQAVNEQLATFARFGVELGLTRIEALLAALGHPHQQVPLIHVAGTNGKGSVCAYLATTLAIAGYRVGRYTSPHLVDWTERLCINNQPIAAPRLKALLDEIQAQIDPHQPSPTQFEVITAAAWLYFAQAQVDVAIMEVGLGGRLDATNVCDRPLLSIVTSIGRDHWQRLGPTLAHIATEKAGILKPNCPAIIGPMPPEVEPVIQAHLAELACPTAWVRPAQPMPPSPSTRPSMPMAPTATANTPALQYQPPQIYPTRAIAQFIPSRPSPDPVLTYHSGLLGAHQQVNSAIAITALRALQAQGWEISTAHIQQGMAQTQWPGRLQWIDWQGRSVLLDGAHNGDAAQQLGQFMRTYRQTESPASAVTWVIGMLDTKDHPAIFQALLQPHDWLYLVTVPDHQSADITKLTTLAQASCPQLNRCLAIASVQDALDEAVANTPTHQPIVVAGSLYLVGFVLHLAQLQTP